MTNLGVFSLLLLVWMFITVFDAAAYSKLKKRVDLLESKAKAGKQE